MTGSRVTRSSGHLPVVRLRRRLSSQASQARRAEVSGALPDACTAGRVRSNPLLWLSSESEPEIEHRTGSPAHRSDGYALCAGAEAFPADKALSGVFCHQAWPSGASGNTASGTRASSAFQTSAAADPSCCRMTLPILCIAALQISEPSGPEVAEVCLPWFHRALNRAVEPLPSNRLAGDHESNE